MPQDPCQQVHDFAKRYGELGYQAFPVHGIRADGQCRCGKPGCESAGKHPCTPHGVKDVGMEFDRHRAYYLGGDNVAIACGGSARLIVIDVDPRHGGEEGFKQLEAQGGPVPAAMVCDTGGGGAHYYTRSLTPRTVPHRFPGVDVRGEGAYVVAPPSLHRSGLRYKWRAGCLPIAVSELPALPEKLEAVIFGGEKGSGTFSEAEKEPDPVSDLADGTTRVSEGGRNEFLFRTAMRLRKTGVEGEALVAALDSVNQALCVVPLPREEVLAVLSSAAKYSLPAAIAPPQMRLVALPHVFLDYPNTEAGAARLLADYVPEGFLYDERRGKWLLFWRGAFRPAGTEDVPGTSVVLLAAFRGHHARSITGGKSTAALTGWLHTLESSSRLSAILKIAEAMPCFRPPLTGFDPDPMALNTPSGLVNLRDGTIREATPKDLVTAQTAAAYDPELSSEGAAPIVQAILPQPALLTAVLRALGYSATGLTTCQVAFVCVGTGSNGKTTFLTAFREAMGSYASNIRFETIQEDSHNITNDLASLTGKRFVTVGEAPSRASFGDGRLRELAGGDPITARFLYGEFFTFKPTAKLWIAMNRIPTLKEAGPALLRRLFPVPFTQIFAGKASAATAFAGQTTTAADLNALDTLRKHPKALLSMIVLGAMEFFSEGLGQSAESVDLMGQFVETDLVADFIRQELIASPGDNIKAGQMYAAFTHFMAKMEIEGKGWLTPQVFGKRIRDTVGYKRTTTGNEFVGVTFRDSIMLAVAKLSNTPGQNTRQFDRDP